MSVKLRQQKNKKGISLYLDICHGGIRERQYLKELTLIINPKTTDDRIKNTQTRITAESIRLRKETELAHELNGMDAPVKSDSLILPYIEQFRDDYTRKDKQKVVAMAFHFSNFQASKEFKFKNLNENIVSDFKKYLEGKVSGATTKSYFNKFRQVIKRAHIDRLCKYDIRTFEARFKIDGGLRKSYLTEKELLTLWNTPLENEQERDAFIFSCFTGLRPVDVRSFKGGDIRNGRLLKVQSKTDQKVEMKVSETGMKIYNKYYKGQDEKLFTNLPTQNGWNKSLAAWVKRAGINKHITTYCSRHTFAMMLLEKGTNWRTIVDLMGWSEGNGMKMLFVYTRAMEKEMNKATEGLITLS